MFNPNNPADRKFLADFPKFRQQLAEEKGVVIARGSERVAADMWGGIGHNGGPAFDAQPQLSTTPNSAIPAWMSYYVYPELMRIIFSPLEAATIAGVEKKVGEWTTTTSVFPVVESAGQVSSYGDFANNGMASFNASFPQRQSYHYQDIVEYGEREVEMVALAKINLVAEKKESSTLTLNMFQNNSYFFGVSGLQNYGLLNDPSLSAAIQPGPKAYNSQANGPWITNGVITASPNEIYTDILSLFIKLQNQTGGAITINNMTEIVLAMHPTSQTAFKQANIYGVTAEKLTRENFPNFRLVQAVQYSTSAGFEVQMFAQSVTGQQTLWVAFTEKLRAHRIVQEMSGWRQKVSQGTWGSIIRLPAAVASMLGV